MTFKIKNKCDKKRDITLLFDTNSINLESGGIHLINDGLHMHYQIIKQLLIRKEEACLNLALASLSSYPKSRLKVYNLRSVDTFFNMYHNDLHNVDLKEYLQLYADSTQSPRKRTLVIFNGHTLEQDNLDILNELQTENNITVIFVSLFDDISNLKQFRRHLKFHAYFGYYNEQVIKQLVDVIKNPTFDRFEFDKTLPSLKDNKRCSKQVMVIPVLLNGGKLTLEFFIFNAIMTVVMRIKHHIREIPMVQPLISWDLNYFVDLFNKHNQQNESGIKEGFEKKLYLIFSKELSTIEKLLKENKQIAKSIILFSLLEQNSWNSIVDEIIELLKDLCRY